MLKTEKTVQHQYFHLLTEYWDDFQKFIYISIGTSKLPVSVNCLLSVISIEFTAVSKNIFKIFVNSISSARYLAVKRRVNDTFDKIESFRHQLFTIFHDKDSHTVLLSFSVSCLRINQMVLKQNYPTL